MHKKSKMRPMAAGRVLSAENESAIRTARDNLDSVLAKIEEQLQDDGALLHHMNRVALKPGRVSLSSDPQSTEAELLIYGDIGADWYGDGITAESITNDIAQLDVETLNVRINSGGGLVFEGVAIYNAIARCSANVIVHIDGIAASIASVIAMAGDEIKIAEGAHIMIHKPWSMAMGDSTSLRKEADILDKLESGIIDLYAARTGSKRADLETWIDAETWFTGQEAVTAGFADEMVPAKKKPANSAMLNLFRNTPQNLLPSGSAPEIREFETFLRDGEGLSNTQAKRIANQAMRGLDRDDPLTPQVKPLRDVGGKAADAVDGDLSIRLATRITQFANQIKE